MSLFTLVAPRCAVNVDRRRTAHVRRPYCACALPMMYLSLSPLCDAHTRTTNSLTTQRRCACNGALYGSPHTHTRRGDQVSCWNGIRNCLLPTDIFTEGFFAGKVVSADPMNVNVTDKRVFKVGDFALLSPSFLQLLPHPLIRPLTRAFLFIVTNSSEIILRSADLNF